MKEENGEVPFTGYNGNWGDPLSKKQSINEEINMSTKPPIEMQKKSKNFSCLTCTKSFKYLNELFDHRFTHSAEHSTENSPNCAENSLTSTFCQYFSCDSREENETRYQDNRDTIFPKTNESLPTDAKASVSNDFKWHKLKYKVHDPDRVIKDEPEKRFKCHICGQSFQKLESFKDHKCSERKNPKRYICELCGKKVIYQTRSDRMSHNCTGSGESLETGYSFRRRVTSGVPKKTYEGVRGRKKRKCPYCEDYFRSMAALKAHSMEIHDKVKLFTCSKCGKEYSRNDRLKVHFQKKHKSGRGTDLKSETFR